MAETEANGEDTRGRAAGGRLQESEGGRDISVHGFRRGLLDVRAVDEGLIARAHTSRAAEIVDGNGTEPGPGKRIGKVFVELMETTDIGQDDHTALARLVWKRRVGHELRPVS